MDKTDRLLDALDHPERLTDDELEKFLADDECLRLLGIADTLAAATAPQPEVDVDAQWKAFADKHRRRSGFFRRVPRKAVAAVAVIAVSLAAVAALVAVKAGIMAPDRAEAPTETLAVTAVAVSDTVAAPAAPSVEAPQSVVFENESLEAIITAMASYYGCSARFADGSPRDLRLYFRWNRAAGLREAVESLNNFERINIQVSPDGNLLIL